MRLMRCYLPAIAMFGWAVAAALGVPADLLRIIGPAAAGFASVDYIRESLRSKRDRGET